MAEDSNNHRIQMQEKLSSAEIADQKRGMYLGAGLFGFLILAALLCALITEDPILPDVFLATAAIGSVGLFIKGRNGG